MDVIEVSGLIYDKVKLLEKMRVEIRQRAEAKAEAGAAYDRIMAVTLLQLKNGKVFELEGEVVSGEKMAANILEKIAKGICWQEQLAADKSEALYKALISNIDAVQTEVNALQSINKNMGAI